MKRVVAAYTALGAGCAFLLSRPGRQACDIDSAHLRWEQIRSANVQQQLPSAYSISSLDELRYRFDSTIAGAVDSGTVQLDDHTVRWVHGEGSHSLTQELALATLSAVMPHDDARARLDLPAVHLLRFCTLSRSRVHAFCNSDSFSFRTHARCAQICLCSGMHVGMHGGIAVCVFVCVKVHGLPAPRHGTCAHSQARAKLTHATFARKSLLTSPDHWAAVLGRKKRQRALDVGAGAGHITRCFAPLFDEVFAVEVSDALVTHLQQCGFTAAKTTRASPVALGRLGMPSGFDAVFALNVLDRVPESDAFLDNLVALTKEDGVLIVALPLPYCAKPWGLVEGGSKECGAAWSKKHALSLQIDPATRSSSWEEAASGVVARLGLAGLRVERLVRVPYLCQGHWGASGPFILDGAVFVARKPCATNRRCTVAECLAENG